MPVSALPTCDDTDEETEEKSKSQTPNDATESIGHAQEDETLFEIDINEDNRYVSDVKRYRPGCQLCSVVCYLSVYSIFIITIPF